MERKSRQMAATPEQEVISLDALAGSQERTEDTVAVEADVDALNSFQVFPDETTANQLFNGIPFKDLPYVILKLHRNNTKLIAK